MLKQHLPLIRTMLKERDILIAWIVFIVVALVLLVTAIINIAPSELQVTVHYTGFGQTNFYRDNWYYLIAFAVLAVILLVAHSLISIKLYDRKGRLFSVFFLWLSVAVAVISELLLIGIFRVIALV